MASVMVLVCGSLQVGAQSGTADCLEVPGNIQVAPPLGSLVARALAHSPTIRQQCLAIAAAPHVRVAVRQHVGRPPAGARATATITRYEHGALFAEIRLPICVNQIEMLAHELEHVLEQMEGVNLKLLSASRAGGVSRLSDGSFETARAEAAGRAAAEEVEGAEAARNQRNRTVSNPSPLRKVASVVRAFDVAAARIPPSSAA